MNTKTNFCVHGATSLIGKNFCYYLLSKDYPITVFARTESNLDFLKDNKKVTIYRYKVSISELIDIVPEIESAIFVNLAWAGVFGKERDEPVQINFNVPEVEASIELSKKIGVKHWIGFGSQAEYGYIDGRIDENHPCNPDTLYGKAKLISSKNSLELCKKYGIECSWLRLFSTYGPYGSHKWFIDYLIDEMKNDRVVNVTKCEQYLDYVYVDDISELLLRLADSHGLGIVNLGGGKAIQLKTILEIIHKITNSKSIINYGALPYKDGQSMFQEADISKITKSINWKPKVDIENGLMDMINKNNESNKIHS